MGLLRKAIEEKREQMIASAKIWGINSKITIQYSQELDLLLNIAQNSGNIHSPNKIHISTGPISKSHNIKSAYRKSRRDDDSIRKETE
ncbi:Spo0E family sporulation regulatory protein-aspartic acid phosphatase [Cytobacillus solani]|uniref:Spo0E family sporulation regulatory protein-aspartic acid phosphatase n=1 Tax=Cytobacillus solani TaxID=1637975 RepID=UPI0035E88ECE